MPQKKLFAALLVAASALLMLGMSNENQIPYPSNYDTKSAGASSYNGLANVPKSPYFQQLDFYNMQPTDSLVLLPKFRTYQQTTECGLIRICLQPVTVSSSGWQQSRRSVQNNKTAKICIVDGFMKNVFADTNGNLAFV